ncbi:hypothetical protein D3C73_1033360 [compost metagenome]
MRFCADGSFCIQFSCNSAERIAAAAGYGNEPDFGRFAAGQDECLVIDADNSAGRNIVPAICSRCSCRRLHTKAVIVRAAGIPGRYAGDCPLCASGNTAEDTAFGSSLQCNMLHCGIADGAVQITGNPANGSIGSDGIVIVSRFTCLRGCDLAAGFIAGNPPGVDIRRTGDI